MKKLYVGNLAYSTNEESLRAVFEEIGQVESVAVITDRDTGRSRGFAFVEMPDEDADRAMKELDGKSVDGRNLRVNEARERERRPPRRDGPRW